jgi:hypothetical protein
VLKIFEFTSNRPDLIEIQFLSFKKYLQEEFSMVVFNNSKIDRPQEYAGINQMCAKYGIEVRDVEIDPELIERCNKIEKSCRVLNSHGVWSNGNCASLYALCWMWENFISKEKGNIGLMHTDVFLDRPVKLTDFLQKSPLCFVPQGRAGLDGLHMHDSLVLMDMSKLPDPEQIIWWGSLVNGIATDIGGQTYFYLKAHPDLNPTLVQCWFKPDEPETDFHPTQYEVFAVDDKLFAVHYYRGSNWDQKNSEYHHKKTIWIKKKIGLED